MSAVEKAQVWFKGPHVNCLWAPGSRGSHPVFALPPFLLRLQPQLRDIAHAPPAAHARVSNAHTTFLPHCCQV